MYDFARIPRWFARAEHAEANLPNINLGGKSAVQRAQYDVQREAMTPATQSDLTHINIQGSREARSLCTYGVLRPSST